MARKPQVTRTIQTTKVTLLCLDIEKGEPFSKELVLPRTYKDEKAILKQAEIAINSDTVKAVHVQKAEVQETLYGMSEQRFIELAEPLPSRNATANSNEQTEETAKEETDEQAQGTSEVEPTATEETPKKTKAKREKE